MALEANEKYCPICGKAVTDPKFNRFGEWACSEAHAEDYVKEIRSKRESVSVGEAGTQSRRRADEDRPGWFGGGRRGCC